MTSTTPEALKQAGQPAESERSKASRRERQVVGWREWVAFPDFEDIRVQAKVDSGARSSSIHAWNIEPFEGKDGRYVRFDLFADGPDDTSTTHCVAPLIGRRKVRSSSGHVDERYFVRTTIKLQEKHWLIELSLANRDEMGFPMLLGRTALKGRYLIDVGRSFLLGKPR